MQLPAKHDFLFFIQSVQKYLSSVCNMSDTMIYSCEQNKNDTCPQVAYSQPGESDIKIPLYQR